MNLPPEQTELSIKSKAETVQLLCVPSMQDGGVFLRNESGDWGLLVPKSAFPFIEPGKPVVVSLTLTSIEIGPAKPGLIPPPKLVI